MNRNRIAELKQTLAFDEPRIKWNATFRKGMQHEKDRLAKLHEALVAAVEALEIMRESLTTEREQRAVVIEKRTREALSKIDKALGDVK